MPNIRQLVSLKEKYANLDLEEKKTKVFLEKGLAKRAIQKSFSFDQRKIILDHFVLPDAPTLIDYFESRPTEDVVLLFIDIARFSTITGSKTNGFITSYLDSFYEAIFPIIYQYGGQIEKLMGDGIICVFGAPFINVFWPQEFNRAELCAKDVIKKFKGTDKEVKVALHSGNITYYKTPGSDYEEYTMIGKPITELYRLESVAMTNSINFYVKSIYDGMNPQTEIGLSKIKPNEIKSYVSDVSLQGVGYSEIMSLKFL